MKPFISHSFTLASVLVLSSLASAHPGHGVDNGTHYVAEPIHQLQVIALVTTMIVVWGFMTVKLRRKRIRG